MNKHILGLVLFALFVMLVPSVFAQDATPAEPGYTPLEARNNVEAFQFAIGDEVVAYVNLTLRDAPQNGTALEPQYQLNAGYVAEIIDGPQPDGEYTRWKVRFTLGTVPQATIVEGWVVDFLGDNGGGRWTMIRKDLLDLSDPNLPIEVGLTAQVVTTDTDGVWIHCYDEHPLEGCEYDGFLTAGTLVLVYGESITRNISGQTYTFWPVVVIGGDQIGRTGYVVEAAEELKVLQMMIPTDLFEATPEATEESS